MSTIKRRVVYDCTPEFAERAEQMANLLSYKKVELVQAPFGEAKAAPDALAILLDPKDSAQAIQYYQRYPKDMEKLGVMDTIFFDGQRLWPDLLYIHAFRDLVFSKVPALNIKLRCYLAGDHLLIEPAVFALSKLGYTQFYWVTRHREKCQIRIDRLKQILLGLQFRSLDTSELTLQNNNGSLILNGVTDPEEIDLLDDLAYLNFLQPPGMIIDLEASQPVDWGASEDQSTGYPVGKGFDLRRCYDALVMKTLNQILSNQP